MSHVDAGFAAATTARPLASYNSLTDPNLSGYFTSKNKRRHLRKMGLITRRGEIVSENTFRINMARKEHQKHVRDLLAQAIVHKTLDMERSRQVQIKRKLEEIAKIEVVRRIKSDRGRRGDEDVLPYLTPRRAMSRPTSSKKMQDLTRPKSAPAPKRQPLYVDEDGFPINPKDIQKGQKKKSPYPMDEIDDRHLYALDQTALVEYSRAVQASETGRPGTSPYVWPLMDPQMPTPPKGSPRNISKNRVRIQPTNGRGKEVKSSSHYQTGTLMLHRVEPAMKNQERVQTLCEVTMHYFGSNLKLDYEKFDPRDEITIEQQHCGGNTLYVFREKIMAHSDFTFTSRRHRGYPFSLTFYINGVLDCRLSTCCEFKHQAGARIGGKTGHFAVVSVEGGTPCYRCQINEQMKEKEKKRQEKKKKKEGTKADNKTEDYDDDFENDEKEEKSGSEDEESDRNEEEEEEIEIKGEGDGVVSAKGKNVRVAVHDDRDQLFDPTDGKSEIIDMNDSKEPYTPRGSKGRNRKKSRKVKRGNNLNTN